MRLHHLLQFSRKTELYRKHYRNYVQEALQKSVEKSGRDYIIILM
jgi:hypothetical protein